MKRYLRWIGTALALTGSAVFIAYVVSSLHVATLRDFVTVRSAFCFAVAVVLYSSIVPISAIAWRRMMAAMGHHGRFRPLLAILLITQAGKYLPGNVGQHLGRIGLSVARGIPMSLLVTSMAYEIVLVLLADLLVALVSGSLSGPGIAGLLGQGSMRVSVVIALAVVAAGLAMIPLLSRLLPPAVAWLMRQRGKGHDAAPATVGGRTMLEVVGLYSISMLIVGGSLYALAGGLFPGQTADYALLTAAFTIAWAVGFVTPGAPAGIGIREALLLAMLSPGMGAEHATVLILALRVATTLGDMLAFAAGLVMMPAKNRPKPPPGDAAAKTRA